MPYIRQIRASFIINIQQHKTILFSNANCLPKTTPHPSADDKRIENASYLKIISSLLTFFGGYKTTMEPSAWYDMTQIWIGNFSLLVTSITSASPVPSTAL